MAGAAGARARSMLLASACLACGVGCSWLIGVSEDPVVDPTVQPPDAASPDSESDATPLEPAESGEADAADEPIDPEDAGIDE